MHGVTGVSSTSSIKPGVNTINMGNDISVPLYRSCFPDTEAVNVMEKDGKVRLAGTVHSWHAHQIAEETAWGAPGAVDVENFLTVFERGRIDCCRDS